MQTGAALGVEHKSLPRVLREYWLATVVLTVVALVVARAIGVRLMMPPAHHFADLLCYKERFQLFRTSAFYVDRPFWAPWTVPAAMALMYRAFYAVQHPVAWYFALFVPIVGASCIAFVQAMRRRGVATSTAIAFGVTALATSYPLWWLAESANLELFVALFVGLGVIAYLRGSLWWAAALFGIATAVKLFPIIYFALFFSRKEYRKMIFGCVVAAVVLLWSHWAVGPTTAEALRGTQLGLQNYTQGVIQAMNPAQICFDHSLFTLVKHPYLIWQTMVKPPQVKLLRLERYYTLAAGLAATILFFTHIRKLPGLNRVLVISILALLLPPVSWDYRLVHLLVPWAFLVLLVLETRPEPKSAIAWMLFAFAILFTPQTYLFYWIGKYGVAFAVGYGAQVKVVVMLLLVYLAIRHPLRSATVREAKPV